MNTRILEDRIAIKELIDNISILADKKDIHNQVQLFSEDAISETFVEGSLFLKLKGRQEMEQAFADYLKKVKVIILL